MKMTENSLCIYVLLSADLLSVCESVYVCVCVCESVCLPKVFMH